MESRSAAYCQAKVAGAQGGFCREVAVPGSDYCEAHEHHAESSAAKDQWLCDVTHPGEPCPADRPAANDQRVEELEEAIRNMLDVVAGWTRPMTDGEKFRAITKIGCDALGVDPDA